MGSIDTLLSQPTSALFVLLVALAISLVSMMVYRYMVDLRRLHTVNQEVRKYNEALKKAQNSGDQTVLRRLRREERRLKQLSGYSQKQRLRVTMITIIPFSLVSLLLGLVYSGRSVANLPFETPFGSQLNFYVWYTICYFAVYFPLTRVFGITMSSDIPRSARSDVGGR
jgi:uncharacterized membrane protein (DUF106 family)